MNNKTLERYNLVSKYINNQTEKEWNTLYNSIIREKIDEIEKLFKNNSDYNKAVQDTINILKK